MVTKSFTAHSGWILHISHLLKVNVNVGMKVHSFSRLICMCSFYILIYLSNLWNKNHIWFFSLNVYVISQVERYGHPHPAGPCRKSSETGVSGSSIPSGNLLNFCCLWIPVNFLCFPAGISRKWSGKIRKISGGNTGSTLRRFPVISCRNRLIFFELGIWRSLNY